MHWSETWHWTSMECWQFLYSFFRNRCRIPLLIKYWIQKYILSVGFLKRTDFFVISLHSKAGFRLACCSPHWRFIAWSLLAVSELQLSAAMPLRPFHRAASLWSWIEVNCLRPAAVGKAARISIDRLDAAYRLAFSLRQVGLAQLNKNHHQSSNVATLASGKIVWKQHEFAIFHPWVTWNSLIRSIRWQNSNWWNHSDWQNIHNCLARKRRNWGIQPHYHTTITLEFKSCLWTLR